MVLARELPEGASEGSESSTRSPGGGIAGGLSLFYVPVQRDSGGRPQVRRSVKSPS